MKVLNLKRVVGILTIFFCSLDVTAQTFKLIPNPDTTSLGFSGYWSKTNSVLNDKKGRKFVCNSISFEVAQQTKTFSHVKNNVVCPDYL